MKAKNILLFYLFILILSPISGHSQSLEEKKMIIVAYHSFISQLSQYVEAKAEDNIECRVIRVDSADKFDSIKAKIDRLYTDFHADFLLLIGDHQHIPAYKVDEGLSDIHYTFEDNSNPIPRMIPGRFSVETGQDLQTMIDRSIERTSFSKHAVGIASGEESELTQKKDYQQVQLMGQQLQSKGFTKVSELFDDAQASGNPNYRDVISSLQTGASWLNYAGYGSYEGWNTSGFENWHIDSLPDNIELPVIVSASCLGGHFANRTCFAEKWMRSTKNGNPTGATAVIMSSSFADWDATLSAMLIIHENMPSTDSNCRLGDLYLQGYYHIINTMQRPKDAYCWILFGDPSLWVYPPAFNTNIPTKEAITSSPVAYPNPASSILYIISEGIVKIYDLYGKLVLNETALKENHILDISSITPGLYFLSIRTGDKIIIQKLVIQK